MRFGLVALLLLPAFGCSGLSETSVTAPRGDLYRTYTERLRANVEQLRTLTGGSDAKNNPFSAETRESLREDTAGLQGQLTRYVEIAERKDREDPQALDRDLDHLSELATKLEEQVVKLSLTVDALENQYESLRLAGARNLGGAERYLTTARQTAALASALEEFLVGLHVRSVRPYASEPSAPDEVFHFLRLAALNYPQRDEHGGFFKTSWNRWIDSTQTDHPDVALGVLALVARHGREHRPESPQKIFEVSLAILKRQVPLETLQTMSSILQQMQSIAGTLPKPAAWERAFRKAEARVQFSAAVARPPSEETIRDAVAALAGDRDLANHVSSYLRFAGTKLAAELVASKEYAEALALLRRTLEAGPGVPDGDQVFARFHAETVEQSLTDVQDSLKTRDYAEADLLLNAVAGLAKDQQQEARAARLRWTYYDQYGRSLQSADPQKSLALARRSLRAFPNDKATRSRVDSILFQQLKEEIGNLDTAHERLGGTALLRQVGQAARKMLTDGGTAECQRLLDIAEVNWSRQARMTADARVAFVLEAEIGKLKGHDGKRCRQDAIASTWNRFRESAAKEEWSTVGSCIDLYFEEFPDQQRPANFKEVYINYLHDLDREKNVKGLGRHAALFAAAYPKETHRIRPLVAKHANRSGPMSRAFGALLTSIATPGSAPTQEPTTQAKPTTPDAEADLVALVPKDVLEKKDTWWQEPDPSVQAALALRGVPSRPSSGVGFVGILLAIVAVLSVGGVSAWTFRRGFLSFRWYALAALAVGATTGYFLDRLVVERSPQLGQKATAEAMERPADGPRTSESL